MASNLRRSKRTIGRRLSYVEAKLNVARRVNVPRRLAPGAVTSTTLGPDVNTTIEGIQSTADGKNTIYRQSSQPTGGTYVEGDLWFDTDDGNKFYRYTSGVWTGFTLGNSAIASIAANKILAGSLDASVIVTSNLDAGQITAGVLSSIEIRAGSPVGGLYPFRVETNGSLRATNATIDGTITSTSGQIGAFTISSSALTAATFASMPFDTSASMSIGSQGQINGRVDVGSFYGTPFYTEVSLNNNDGSGITVRGTASGSYLETRIRASFITSNQMILPGGDIQTQLNGKSSTSHNHDSSYSSTSHTHAYIPTSGITQNGDITLENTNTGSNAAGQNLQLRRRYTANGDNWIQFVRVATVGPPAYSELAVGAIQFASASTLELSGTSDARLKENVEELKGTFDTFRNLRPVKFDWIGDHQEEKQVGFIAQELYDVLPSAVSVGGEDVQTNPWMVGYSTFTPILVAAVKELIAKVETLEEKIAQLEAR